MSLTDNEVKILTYIDQRFWETGGLVSDDKICQDLKLSNQIVKNAWKKPEFRQGLVARGVDLTPNATDGLLTPTQIMLANLLMNIGDKRSTREKCELLGVSTQQFTAWMRQPAFAGYLRKRAEHAFSASDYEAYNTLMDQVRGGDMNAVKLFFEMRGIYNPRTQVDINVNVLVTRLVEIVAKHVTDPTVLEAIAHDVEALEMGGSVSPVSIESSPVGAFI